MADSSKAGPDSFLLVIGAMKSGTTSLFELLAQHPEVAPSRIKEPDYFSEPEVFARGQDWYRGLWDWDPAKHRVALEASVSYTKAPGLAGVPERIADFPDARFRFVYVLRNPVDQIRSHARHATYAGWETSLAEGIPDYMISIASYAMQIDQYMEYFSKSDLLLLTLEEFSSDPKSVLERICRFAEIDPGFEFSGIDARYNAGDVYEMPGLLSRLLHSAPVRVLKSLLPRRAWHAARGVVASRLASRRAVQESPVSSGLSDEQQRYIREQLATDIERLRSVYGLDVEAFWR